MFWIKLQIGFPKMVNLTGVKITSVGNPKYGSNIPLQDLRDLYLSDSMEVLGIESTIEQTFTPSQKKYAPVKKLLFNQQKRILVTGGAGFVGSHLVDR